MSKKFEVTLVIGEEITQKVTRQDALELTNNIKNLRKESSFLIPLIHITDETKIETDYEIRFENKKILAKNVSKNVNTEDLVKIITADIEEVCRQYAV